MKDNKVEATQMFLICRKMQQIDPYSLMCLDFLTSEYTQFVDMMLDFKKAFLWEGDE